MYQSPVAAIAELIANSWDADAQNVDVVLPESLGDSAEIVVRDDGVGMTFQECQDRYLNVGYGRRGEDPDQRSRSGRPILGRKGIGKFAGFGIADIVTVETISQSNGERTVFEMNLSKLRGDEYITADGAEVDIVQYEPPADTRKGDHGTVVRLRNLGLRQRPSPQAFARSMARRFLLHQEQEGFQLTVNGVPLPSAFDLAGVEYIFPRDYVPAERPDGLHDSEDWGAEVIGGTRRIRWRVMFFQDTIDDEELRGVSIFAKGKLVQRPFLFNLAGGLGGQHGVEYLTGQVVADYLDLLPDDLTAPERQRINWESDESTPLLEWGQTRIKELLRIWKAKRGEARARALDDKVVGFSGRLEKLGRTEARTVERAIRKVAAIPTLSPTQFNELGDAILDSWERGRLKNLIDSIANANDLSEESLLQVLVEADVLTALNTAEAVRTKFLTVAGLKDRIEKRDLENAVRDYIAGSPWLISAEWETFRKETTVAKLLQEAAGKAKLVNGDWSGRVDLALSSGDHLLVLEFMRPGIRLNFDHLGRFELYVRTIRVNLKANTGGRFQRATGYLVADGLDKDPVFLSKLESMVADTMYALDWHTLFGRAAASWQELFDIIVARAPDDDRLRSLLPEPQEAAPKAADEDGA